MFSNVGKYISEKNIIFFIILILCLIFITKIKDIAILFFASYVISCSLNPVVDKLSKKMSRGIASFIVILGCILVLLLFFAPIILTGGHQVKSFLRLLPAHFEAFKAYLTALPLLKESGLSQINFSDVVSSAFGFTSNVVSSSITFSKELFTVLIYFLGACIITYYFMIDKDTVKSGFLKMFPSDMKAKAEDIFETISQKIGGYVLAQIVTMASVGIIMLAGLLILKVDYPLILALITALFDIVPVVGPAVALVVIIIAVSKLSLLKIGLVILLFAFAQWAENNLVRPYIFSKLLNIHPLIIYFFLFVTAQYLGVIGVVFAPAIAATVCVLIEELYIKNING